MPGPCLTERVPVCRDVCAFLDGVLQTGSRVSRYERTKNKEAIHFSQVFRYDEG